MEVIRIEGVEFELEEAREFVERALLYAEAKPPMDAERANAIAVGLQVEVCLRGKDRVDVTLDETEVVASAVLAEWLQSRGAPEAARTLYRVLASG